MSGLRFEHVGFGDDRVEYERAWALQRELHARVVAGEAPDTVLLLEHPPVYTAGRRTHPADRPFDGTPVIDVDRGGRITWHGPGQIVGYPIVKLASPVDVVAYVRRLEEALIRRLRRPRRRGRPGRGPQRRLDRGRRPAGRRRERKVGAIGVRVAQGVTMHGFALNCDPDLSWFSRIVPCGIPDADVTSLVRRTGPRRDGRRGAAAGGEAARRGGPGRDGQRSCGSTRAAMSSIMLEVVEVETCR